MSRHRHSRAAPAPSQRQLRVGELVRHALAELLARGEVRDPELVGLAVTVSEVTVSPDLKRATAYVIPLGGTRSAETLAALERSARFLRGRLAGMLDLRHVPEISYRLDTSFDHSDRMRGLLASPGVRRDIEPEGGG